MRQLMVGLSVSAVAFLLVLVACSAPVFDPAGSYTGTITETGSPPAPFSATITDISSAVSWDFLLAGSGLSYPGTCTHDTAVTANHLSCSLTGSTIVLEGTLSGSTWQGTYEVSGSPIGTFSFTR